MEEKILTPDQVAETLQIHPFTVLKFIKQGKLKASKLGRVYRIRSSDVDKFLDDQANQARAKDDAREAKKRNKQSEKIETPKIITPDTWTTVESVEEVKNTPLKNVDPFIPLPKTKEVKGDTPISRENSSDFDHYILE